MNEDDLKQLGREIDRAIKGLYSTTGMIDQASFRMGKSAKKDVDKLEAMIERPLPELIRGYYRQVGSYTLDWKYQSPKNPYHKIYGVSTLFGPAEMLNHPDPIIDLMASPKYERLLWNEGDDPELVRQLQDLYILDELRYDNFVLIRFPPERDDAELYLYTRPHTLSKLALDFEAYVRQSLKARGMYLWQQYCLEKDAEPVAFLPDCFHANMEQLFPGTDLSAFSRGERAYYPYEVCVLDSQARYTERIEGLVDGLREDVRIENVALKMNRINPGAHPADVHRSFLALGFALPKAVLELYQEVNGLSLRWRSTNGGGLEAEFQLLTLEDLFAGFDPEGLAWVRRRKWDHNAAADYAELGASGEKIQRFEGYLILYREERANVLVRFEEDGEVDLMLVVDDDPYRMRIGFTDFVDRLLAFRGVKYWSYFFTDADPYTDLGLPKDYVDRVEALFPDTDVPQRPRII